MFTLRPLRFNCRLFRARLVGFILACLGAIMSPASASAQTVLHVAQAAASGGNGSSWGLAFTHPQQALNAAAGIGGQVIIKVAQGTYVPSLRTDAGDPRSVTFHLRNNTTLSGGYAGPGTADPDARDVAQHETILSGDLYGDDEPNFVNYEENAYHVLIGSNTDATAVLDGFTVSGGNAKFGAYFEGGGGGASFSDASPVIRRCVFSGNQADEGGAIHSWGPASPLIFACRFIGNVAEQGGAIYFNNVTSISLTDCVFQGNTAVVSGCIQLVGTNPAEIVSLVGCTFIDNSAYALGAINLTASVQGLLHDCLFIGNSTEVVGGAGSVAGKFRVANSRFEHNSSILLAAALVAVGDIDIVNSAFSDNNCPGHGSVIASGHTRLSNTTIANGIGHAIVTEGTENTSAHSLTIHNCIIWGHSDASIFNDSTHFVPMTVSYSNIQGGWTGSGGNNIDEDPLFIQTSCGNLRLSHDSPCIDAGSNALIPVGVTTDLAGNPRIQNGTVDMGAYEGGHDMMPAAACADYLAQGITVRLVPNGGEFSPLYNPGIVIRNTSDPDMGNAMVTQTDFPLHPTAGGFNELGSALTVTTSIPNGQFWMRVVIPFTAENLNGFAPEDVELTFYDESENKWKLSASANVANSPGHSGPLGDRLFTQGTTNQFGLSPDLGDYGVFWNPQLQQGFAWANVDHATDFAIGIPLPQCSGDCQYPGNALVNIGDLQTVIEAWGAVQSGPLSFADITRDGGVNVPDLLAVMNGWGPCR